MIRSAYSYQHPSVADHTKNTMNDTIILFESKYGSTEKYAKWIAEELYCPLMEVKSCKPADMKGFNTIIYGGGLYAGGVSGIKLLTKNCELLAEKNVIIFTCGLADPDDPENVSHIRKALSNVLPVGLRERVHLFHFRGGIDYSRLSIVHRAMMSMLRKALLKKDEKDLRQEDRYLLDTYGKRVDFTDRRAILPLVELVRELNDRYNYDK